MSNMNRRRYPTPRPTPQRHPAQWLYALMPVAALVGAVLLVVELVGRA